MRDTRRGALASGPSDAVTVASSDGSGEGATDGSTDALDASPGLDPEIIRRYVRLSDARIRHCYESQRQANPPLTGTVESHFSILPTGEVSAATASGLDPEVARCVAGVLQTIAFPSSDRPTDVNYPFHFVPVD
jgi:hypothetical protein